MFSGAVLEEKCTRSAGPLSIRWGAQQSRARFDESHERLRAGACETVSSLMCVEQEREVDTWSRASKLWV